MRIFSMLVTAFTIVLVGSVQCVAATYDVTACASHPLARSASFEQVNTSPATLATTEACRGTPIDELDGLVAADRPGSLGTLRGRIAASTITAAAGTSIRAVRARRYLGKRDNDWHVWVRSADGTVLESCEINASFACTVGALPTSPQSWTTYSGLATGSVSFGVSCRGTVGECVSAPSVRSAWAIVYSTVTTVEDPAPPTSVALSGQLVDAGRGWVSGNLPARAAAEDASGIRRLEVLADGVPIGAAEGPCDFGLMRPCPGRLEADLWVDLGAVADGEHRLTTRAYDAAGSSSESSAAIVKVDTSPPGAPLELRAVARPNGGYTVTWRNPDQGAGAPIAAAHYQLCMVGSNDCVSGGVTPGDQIATIAELPPPPGRAPWDLLVWLQDGAGHADRSRAARVTLVPVPAPGGPPPGPGAPSVPGPPDTPRRSSPAMRISSAFGTGDAIVIRGTLKRAASGRVVVSLRRLPSSRAWASRTVVARRGKFVVRFRNRSAVRSRRAYVTARFLGTRSFASQTVARPVRRSLRR